MNRIQRLLTLLLLVCGLSTGGWALEQDGEGYYLLSSVQDWQDFAALVQTTPTANAKMTADIDLGDDQTMVGTEAVKYQGTFDGQGHTLDFAYNVSVNRAAPFFYINNATIRNLHTAGSLRSTGESASGVVGEAHGTCHIQSCHSSVAINGLYNGNTYGGFVGVRASGGNLTISDCLFDGSITTTQKMHNGGFVGYSFDNAGSTTAENCLLTATFNCGSANSCTFLRYTGTITNCYFLNALGAVQGTQANAVELASGRVAYLLQAGRSDMFWGQTIGVDAQPVLTNDPAKWVYKHHDGTYSNTPDNFSLQQDIDGYCLIGSVQDWKDFADCINNGYILSNANARMTADIDLGTDLKMVGMNFDLPYRGIFDGQGHTLTVNWTVNGEERAAPFRYAEGATIQGLHVDGSIVHNGGAGSCISGIISCSIGDQTTTIKECWSSVSLTAFDTMGGFLSVACGNGITNITDCMFSGTITASNSEGCSGGFASHADNSYLYHKGMTPILNITRGLNMGSFSSNQSRNYSFVRDDIDAAFGTHNVTDCYYKNADCQAQGTLMTAEQIADGTIATALQAGREEEVWVQDPETNQPMLKIFANKNLILGDANDSGAVEIGDITSVLTLMATPDATGYNNQAADANQSGGIEIGDITTILTIMAGGE